MFYDVPSMYIYLEKLKETVERTIFQKKELLNYNCEICKENPIEVEYKPNNFTEEFEEDEITKIRVNCMFFCKSCYRDLLLDDLIDRSEWMIEIDKELLEGS
jgi:hypothetical protein